MDVGKFYTEVCTVGGVGGNLREWSAGMLETEPGERRESGGLHGLFRESRSSAGNLGRRRERRAPAGCLGQR